MTASWSGSKSWAAGEELKAADLNSYADQNIQYLYENLIAGTGLVGALVKALTVDTDHLRVTTSKTPAAAASPGSQGDIAWDSNYLYVCVASNSWKRVAIAAW